MGIFWSNETGVAFRDGTPIRYGLIGSSDIIGCARGRFVGVEVKTGKAQLSTRQVAWAKAIERAGGIAIVGRSVGQVIDDLLGALASNDVR
jgi:predicted Holliday junction resolvase-like endonuclease